MSRERSGRKHEFVFAVTLTVTIYTRLALFTVRTRARSAVIN